MNKQYHLSKEWFMYAGFLVLLHMITFGVTAYSAYRKYRNVSFELTDTAIKFRNGRLTRTINYRTRALCEMAILSGLRRLAKNHWWFSLSFDIENIDRV